MKTEPIIIRGELPTQGMKPAVAMTWVRKKATKQMRADWHALGKLHAPGRPMHQRVHLVYRYAAPSTAWLRKTGVLLAPNSKPYAPTDRDNMRSAAKPALDGLQDAGVIAGDTYKHILTDPVEYVGRASTGAGWLELVITPVVDGE
jgi:hypothetical protein